MRTYKELQRRLIDWEWYSEKPTRRLFLHLLVAANNRVVKQRGEVVKRGMLMVSLAELVDETDLTQKQVRTALERLRASGDVATSPKRYGYLLTVRYYEHYHSEKINGIPDTETPEAVTVKNEKRPTNGTPTARITPSRKTRENTIKIGVYDNAGAENGTPKDALTARQRQLHNKEYNRNSLNLKSLSLSSLNFRDSPYPPKQLQRWNRRLFRQQKNKKLLRQKKKTLRTKSSGWSD